MNTLKVIKSLEQYYAYCDELERLHALMPITAENEDRIDLLTVLIEKWDEEHHPSVDIHPVELLKQLMEMHDLNASELSRITGIDKTVLSKIINNKKGFSKDIIRTLATYFKVNQEAFNRPYSLEESKVVEGTLAKSGQRT
jgi:HTH-type transcriptional regulator/antitoxin HigA